jgi:hypothetical protein
MSADRPRTGRPTHPRAGTHRAPSLLGPATDQRRTETAFTPWEVLAVVFLMLWLVGMYLEPAEDLVHVLLAAALGALLSHRLQTRRSPGG